MLSPDHVLESALRYARTGWPVFPCQPGAKTPAGVLVPHGCLEASTDPATITAWWSHCPTANVAIATGAPGPDVVDVDVKGDRTGGETFERLRRAGLLRGAGAIVSTPSGGIHLYYAGSDQRNGALPRHGVDFRSRGGYVLAPPSTVDGRAYELVESRELDTGIDFAMIRRHLDPPAPRPHVRPGSRGDHAALVRWVGEQGEGNRNNALYWAACRAVETGGDLGVLAALADAAAAAGLPEDEAVRTVQSAQRRTEVRR